MQPSSGASLLWCNTRQPPLTTISLHTLVVPHTLSLSYTQTHTHTPSLGSAPPSPRQCKSQDPLPFCACNPHSSRLSDIQLDHNPRLEEGERRTRACGTAQRIDRQGPCTLLASSLLALPLPLPPPTFVCLHLARDPAHSTRREGGPFLPQLWLRLPLSSRPPCLKAISVW